MNIQFPRVQIPPHPELDRFHRRKVFWQIWFPIGLGSVICLIFLGLVIESTRLGNPQVASMAHLATVLLLAPAAVVALGVMGVLIGLIFLALKIPPFIPRYSRVILAYMDMIRNYAVKGANQAVRPIVSLRTGWAGLRTVLRGGKNDTPRPTTGQLMNPSSGGQNGNRTLE